MDKNMNTKKSGCDKYADMLYMSRPASMHPRMSMENRAGQFAPFAALNGFDGLIAETGRRTDKKIDISDEQIKKINETLARVMQNESTEIMIKVTYFEPDALKGGGKYVIKSGTIKSIDEITGVITFADGARIEMENVAEAVVLSENTR